MKAQHESTLRRNAYHGSILVLLYCADLRGMSNWLELTCQVKAAATYRPSKEVSF